MLLTSYQRSSMPALRDLTAASKLVSNIRIYSFIFETVKRVEDLNLKLATYLKHFKQKIWNVLTAFSNWRGRSWILSLEVVLWHNGPFFKKELALVRHDHLDNQCFQQQKLLSALIWKSTQFQTCTNISAFTLIKGECLHSKHKDCRLMKVMSRVTTFKEMLEEKLFVCCVKELDHN